MGAAMMGGAVMAGRASQRARYREQDQETRLEGQQQAPVAEVPAAEDAERAAV